MTVQQDEYLFGLKRDGALGPQSLKGMDVVRLDSNHLIISKSSLFKLPRAFSLLVIFPFMAIFWCDALGGSIVVWGWFQRA